MINSDFVKKRVVIYARVSTEHEAQISALENQMDWYKPILAARPEWTLVGQYVDEGITGTSAAKRPQFMKMIADAMPKSEKSESEITTNTVSEVTTAVEQIEKFDISYWISYAQNYAQSIGFTLEKTATECWDNPISANANSKNIGADIESRLNRYKNVDGFTSVWIWAEKVSDTQYELYIGYA